MDKIYNAYIIVNAVIMLVFKYTRYEFIINFSRM